MLISEFCRHFPGEVLSQRIVKDDIGTPRRILFITKPESLSQDVLYLIDGAQAGTILPECSARDGAVVICAGSVPAAMTYQVSISLVSVDCGLLELYNCASDELSEMQKNSSIEAEKLKSKFASIVEGNVPVGMQVENICATFPNQVHSSYCIICAEVSDAPKRISRTQMLQEELQNLFAGDNVTHYDSVVVVIHSYDGFTHPPKLPEDELTEVLKKYDACAGVSNGMRKLSQMRMMYILARKALVSGRTLLDGEKKIFYYDDTMLFSIASYAATAFQDETGNDDIVLLGSPVISNIIKHDPKGKRELLETLFQYIKNGMSTSKTAEAMHMHRNTVQNRISMIEEIAGEQITRDGMLQAKLLVTYYIIQYYNKVWNKNLVLSPLCESQDKVVELDKK